MPGREASAADSTSYSSNSAGRRTTIARSSATAQLDAGLLQRSTTDGRGSEEIGAAMLAVATSTAPNSAAAAAAARLPGENGMSKVG